MEEKVLTKEELTLALDEFGMGFLADSPSAREILPALRTMSALEEEFGEMVQACAELDSRIAEQFDRTMETAGNLAMASSFLGRDSTMGKVTTGLAAATAIFGIANAIRQENAAQRQKEQAEARIRAKRAVVAKEKLDHLIKTRPKVEYLVETLENLYNKSCGDTAMVGTPQCMAYVEGFKKVLVQYTKAFYLEYMLNYFIETYGMWMQYVENNQGLALLDDAAAVIIEGWRKEDIFNNPNNNGEIPLRALYVLTDPFALKTYSGGYNNINLHSAVYNHTNTAVQLQELPSPLTVREEVLYNRPNANVLPLQPGPQIIKPVSEVNAPIVSEATVPQRCAKVNDTIVPPQTVNLLEANIYYQTMKPLYEKEVSSSGNVIFIVTLSFFILIGIVNQSTVLTIILGLVGWGIGSMFKKNCEESEAEEMKRKQEAIDNAEESFTFL